jgi:cysteine desulfurase / selenocysteine lyase
MKRIYLDNAATTFPKPVSVYEKTFDYMKTSAGNPGRGAHFFSNSSSETVENTRRQVAAFFRLPDYRRVVFTPGCTESINIVLKGYLKTGNHVIATNLDHNSVSRPLEHLRHEWKLEVTRIAFDRNGFIDPLQVRAAIRNNTTLIVLNHGSNVLGTVQALEAFLEIASETGIPLLLDAAQTAGRIPIEIGNAPVFIACSGHKGLYGMPGLGILTVPAGIELSKWIEGGSGTSSESLHHPDELPMRLEAGTPNFLAIASLAEGIRFIEEKGIDSIHSSEMNLVLRLWDYLRSNPKFVVYSQPHSGQHLAAVSFNLLNVSPTEVAMILDQRFEIAVRGGLQCAALLHEQLGTSPDGCVRVSPGYFNTGDEIKALTEALGSIAAGY